MATLKQVHSAKAVLTKLIKSKVRRMDMPGLVALAAELNVPVPASARSIRARERKPMTHPILPTAQIMRGSGIGPVVSTAEGGRLLDECAINDEAVDWVESELVGAVELVARLAISRGTLDNWRKKKNVIGLRRGRRNFLYPLRQFERRRPIEGLDVIAPLFASADEMWEWLVAPNCMTGGMPPIEKLRAGGVALVMSAAEGMLDYA